MEKAFKKAIKKILQAQGKAIINAFIKLMTEKKANGMSKDEAEKKANELIDKIFKAIEAGYGTDKIVKELLPLWTESGKLGNQFLNNIQFTKPEDGTLFAVINDDYTDWLDTYGADMVTNVNQTTKDITKQIIKDGLVNGDSTAKIAKALSDKIEEYSESRSTMIALTETHNSFMKGNFMTAETSGFKYKTWITAGDSHVRASHQELNGMKIEIDKDFKSGLGHPGDDRAPASETVYCRCILYYE